jgi:hypothetical protein
VFLENLNVQEKAAFLGLAQHLIRADGVLAAEEENLLATLSAQSGAIAPLEGSPAHLADQFETRRSKVSALLELMGLGFADGEYHPLEKALVLEVALAFGIDKAELFGMESWVIRQTALLEEARHFWNEQEA